MFCCQNRDCNKWYVCVGNKSRRYLFCLGKCIFCSCYSPFRKDPGAGHTVFNYKKFRFNKIQVNYGKGSYKEWV
nr:MAG TPA: hypothetical protein [Caudoviricetes sp.]